MKTKLPSALLLFILTCGSFFVSFAQSRFQNLDLAPLLFKNFVKADIVKKDGSNVQASVNYNTSNQSIIFLMKDEYMEMTGLEEIEEIKIDSDIFVPIEGKIFQKTDRNDLFVSYSNKVVVNDVVSSKPGTEIKDARVSSNVVSDVYVSRNYKSPNNLAFVKKFWMMNGKQLVDISNEKKLSKIFNISKNEINEFVKEHNLNFNNYNDVTVLLDYLNKGRK